MKLKFVFFLMLLTPSAAFAHLINYDSKPYLDLAKGNSERANLIAHFCILAADSVEDCMSRLLVAKGEIAAEKCGREIQEISEKVAAELHLTGGVPGKPESGLFHYDTICTSSEGCHSYGFTLGTRGLSGEKAGTDSVRMAREQAVKLQETKNESTEVTGKLEGVLKIIGTLFGSGGEGSVKVGGEYKDKDGKTVTEGGLDQYEIAKAYNRGFEKGWNNPWTTSKIAPDIFFANGKTETMGADGKMYKLNSSQPVPVIPKDLLKDEGPVSVSKPRDDEPKSGPVQPNSPAPSFEESKDLLKSGASIDASNSKDGTWAQIQPAQSGDISPIQACYELEMYKIKKKEAVKNVEGDEFTYAQQKEKAESNLQLGFCDESFYGREFCADWKFKQSLNVDETLTGGAPKVDQPFEEISSWEKPDTAPILDVDPGCNPICPIEVQPF